MSWTDFVGLGGGCLASGCPLEGCLPSQVNAVLGKLQCRFMVGDVCVCLVGSWIQLEMNRFSFLFTIIFQPYHQIDKQNQYGQEGGDHGYGNSFRSSMCCHMTVAAWFCCIDIKPQYWHQWKCCWANEKAIFQWWCYAWPWLWLLKCLWYFLPNHKRLRFHDKCIICSVDSPAISLV